MKDGDFVTIDYVGRIKETGKIFDLTKEDLAKKEDVHNEKIQYGPVTFILGTSFVIRGLDEALHNMKVGEEKNVEIPPEKAFGERKEELVKLIPESQFKQQNTEPTPGATVTVNNIRGKIVSVGGGRVKVDFNHPLAGKTLQYEIEVKGIVTDKTEKVKSVVKYFTGKDMKVKVGKEAEVEVEMDMQRRLKEIIAQTISKWIDIETVKFTDIFKNPKEKEVKADGKQSSEIKSSKS
jgi:FKBP-type peptidyl-prolyl cis-trans isomerase 2